MLDYLVIIMIRIAFTGAVQDFFQSPHCSANLLRHVRSSGPGAIERLSCATCRVTCFVVRRDSSAIKFDRVENRIYLSFILVAEPVTD